MPTIRSKTSRGRQDRSKSQTTNLDLLKLLRPAPLDPEWEADKAGWRSFVMGTGGSCYRQGSKLHRAWQRGYDAASRSADPERLML